MDDGVSPWQMRSHKYNSQTAAKEVCYYLHGKELKHVPHIKYLGVNISHDLRWDKHIDSITLKATNTLNFLRRNINIRNSHAKLQAYKSLVRPILEYSSTVWDPYTNKLINQIEMVQRRAARFALHRYNRTSSVGCMLQILHCSTLAERRRVARLSMFYKIQNQLVAIDPCS